MNKYNVIQNSVGEKRSFSITVGLKEGYDHKGKVHDIRELIQASLDWMQERVILKQPYLPGLWEAKNCMLCLW